MENSLKKKNVKLRGLKEQVDRDNLVQYLQDLFIGCASSDCYLVIGIVSVHLIGQHNSRAKYPRDIIIKFPNK